jgi:hypothetical protein
MTERLEMHGSSGRLNGSQLFDRVRRGEIEAMDAHQVPAGRR